MERKDLNPYAPSTIAFQRSPHPSQLARRNPSRFLLYPLAAICISLFNAAGYRYLINGFQFRTAHVFDAGIQILIGLFGISAFLLARRRLSIATRRFTMVWSIAAVSVLTIGMFVDRLPSSVPEIFLIVFTFSVFLLVGFLAFRSCPREHALSQSVSESST